MRNKPAKIPPEDILEPARDLPAQDKIDSMFSIVTYWSQQMASTQKITLEAIQEIKTSISQFIEAHNETKALREAAEVQEAKSRYELARTKVSSPKAALTESQRSLLAKLKEQEANEIDWVALRKKAIESLFVWGTLLVAGGVFGFIAWLVMMYIRSHP